MEGSTKYAALVLQRGVGKLVLEGIGKLHVADGIPGGLDLAGNPFVPLAAEADRPVDRGAVADAFSPIPPLTLER